MTSRRDFIGIAAVGSAFEPPRSTFLQPQTLPRLPVEIQL
jgi:hypothetical protein